MSTIKHSLGLSLCFLFSALATVAPAMAQDWEKVELHSLVLGEDIWMLYGAGGNHVLAGSPKSALLVDTDYNEVSDKLLASIWQSLITSSHQPRNWICQTRVLLKN